MGSQRRAVHNLAHMLIIGLAALLGGCSATAPMSYLDPKGPIARVQYDLLMLSLYFAVGIGAVVAFALVYVVMKFRARPGLKGEGQQIHGNAKLEILWTVIPVVILVIMAVPMVRAAFVVHESPEPTTLTIRATGVQWFFAFEYPGLGITTANEIYIPVGRPVKLEITGHDVIHSFWIPKLAGKTDMIPGRLNVAWVEADEEGVFWGQCAEFCGTAHAQMRFRVFAVSPQKFDDWVRNFKTLSQVTDPVAVRGKALVEGADKSRATCFACHAIEGSAAQGIIGPSLTKFGNRTYLGSGWAPNTVENLRQWIRSPQEIKPGAKMPAHQQLTEDELTAIVTYLHSLK